MADTKRTLSALTALYADNNDGDISAQDLRDFLISAHGSRYVNTSAIASSDTADTDDDVMLVDASAGAVTITLPDRASNVGKVYTIKRVNATNNVIVSRAGSDTIDGATTKTLSTQYAAITIIAGYGGWSVLSTMGTVS